MCPHIGNLFFTVSLTFNLGLVWIPSFGAGIKEFIYDSINYLFGCQEIGYVIHFKFYGFLSHA
jgi:hypothetical protein